MPVRVGVRVSGGLAGVEEEWCPHHEGPCSITLACENPPLSKSFKSSVHREKELAGGSHYARLFYLEMTHI